MKNLDGINHRPVLLVGVQVSDIRSRRCTSQSSSTRSRDVIEDYMDANLEKETFVDREVRTIPSTHLVRKLGTLSQYDREKFRL